MKTITWLASYPKSGNTWTRSFLRAYQYDAYEPIDLNQIGRISKSDSRLTHFQKAAGDPERVLTDRDMDSLRGQVLEQIARTIGVHQVAKTHNARLVIRGVPLIPAELTNRAVYVVRNPLDVVDSLADHNNLTIDQAIDIMNDPEHTIGGGPEQPYVRQYLGTWSSHVRTWTQTTEFPVLVLKYEDMLADPTATFRSLLRFLGWYFDEERLHRAIKFSSFSVLQQAERQHGFKETSHLSRSGTFFRRGRANTWKETLSPTQISRLCHQHAEIMQPLGYSVDVPGDGVASTSEAS